MKRFLRGMILIFAAMAALRFIPGLAAPWRERVAVPLLGALNRLTSALPFPALEPLALLAVLLCLRRRERAVALAAILGMYGLLWYPAYFADPAAQTGAPGDAEALCAQLTDALNAAGLEFSDPLETAGDAAGLPWARVKPARYPEWMRALGIAGLFSPWTGEALVDPGAPPGELPFTCVHELMHLRGIADEGAANVAAWRACMDRGGMYADSARLWALRYAMARLDEAGRERMSRRMKPRLRAMLTCAAPKDTSPLDRLMGIGEQTRDYDALLEAAMEDAR